MTKFVDGPADGQTLMLKRQPLFLRVVRDGAGKWDALDQLHDSPRHGEEAFVYVHVADDGCVFVRPGGMYRTTRYALFPQQPSQAVLRDTVAWRGFTAVNYDEAVRFRETWQQENRP